MDEFDIQEKIRMSSSPYLAAPEGYWMDADGKVIDICEMTSRYRENCLKLLEHEKKNIEYGFFLAGIECSPKEKLDIVKYAVSALEEKKKSLSQQ